MGLLLFGELAVPQSALPPGIVAFATAAPVAVSVWTYVMHFQQMRGASSVKRGARLYLLDLVRTRMWVEKILAVNIVVVVPCGGTTLLWLTGVISLDALYFAAVTVFGLAGAVVMFERQGDMAPNADGTDLHCIAAPHRPDFDSMQRRFGGDRE